MTMEKKEKFCNKPVEKTECKNKKNSTENCDKEVKDTKCCEKEKDAESCDKKKKDKAVEDCTTEKGNKQKTETPKNGKSSADKK